MNNRRKQTLCSGLHYPAVAGVEVGNVSRGIGGFNGAFDEVEAYFRGITAGTGWIGTVRTREATRGPVGKCVGASYVNWHAVGTLS